MKGNKVAFFFGAGAEGGGNYDIVTGLDYLKASLYGEGIGNYLDALHDYFRDRYFDKKYIYLRQSFKPTKLLLRNMIIAKIRNDHNGLIGMSNEIARILTNDDINELGKETDAEISSIEEAVKDSGDKENDNLKKYNAIKEMIEEIKKAKKTLGDSQMNSNMYKELEEILKNNKKQIH